jgi:hypothetical protein
MNDMYASAFLNVLLYLCRGAVEASRLSKKDVYLYYVNFR